MRGNGTVGKPATNGNALVLPSFFIIGPPRTGTSWLHEVLSKRVSLSYPTKETRFFDRHFSRGLEWYASHYRTLVPGRPVGEVAPTYFASPEARERIAALIPQAGIVCTFRNPVDRVVSLYRLKRAYGFIPWNFEEALERDPELMESSRYSANLKEWQKTFGPSQVLVTMHEDMQADPQGYLDRLVDFIGVPRVTLVASHRRRVLTSEDMTEPRNYYLTRGAILLSEWSRARRLDSVVAVAKKWGALKFFVGGGLPFPEVPSIQRAKLRELFRPDVDELEGMLNRNLSSWK
jgi:hypothetical protein